MVKMIPAMLTYNEILPYFTALSLSPSAAENDDATKTERKCILW